MTWTYLPTTTNTRPLDQVRLLVGDTDASDPQLQDEEVGMILASEPDPLTASINAAETLAAKYARQVDTQVGDAKQGLSALLTHYRDLASQLRLRLARRGVSPYAGGLSKAEKISDIENDDLVQPFARKDDMTEPGTDHSTPLDETFYVPR